MKCPKCGSNSRVISVNRRKPEEVRRYRKCVSCNANFVTSQPPELLQEKITVRIEGEKHPNSKLTRRKVREMRQYAAEGASSFECAFVWDVTQTTAHKAITRRTWKHVD